MSELLDLHSSHLVDALNAAMGGCPRAAMRSLQDASWSPASCVGEPAPDPAYTSHRIYRRFKVCPIHGIPECMCDDED